MALDVASKGSETHDMASEDPEQLHLHRIDPDLNMRRFYALALQPTLFGGASLIRNWGRIGTNGQSMMETFDEPEEATAALAGSSVQKGAAAIAMPTFQLAVRAFEARHERGEGPPCGGALLAPGSVPVRPGPDQLQAFLAFDFDQGRVDRAGSSDRPA